MVPPNRAVKNDLGNGGRGREYKTGDVLQIFRSLPANFSDFRLMAAYNDTKERATPTRLQL